MISVFSILNPRGFIKYPATPPMTMPMGTDLKNRSRPSLETNFFSCFFVMPIVRSWPN